MTDQQPHVTLTRLLVGVVVGFMLFQVVVVDLVGILAAVTVPRAYFIWFGKEHQELAQAVLQLASAIPVFLLVGGGVLAATSVMRTRSSAMLVALFVGMLLCFLFWAASSLIVPFDFPIPADQYPLGSRFKQLFMVPWWAYPVMLAPWLGFGFAAWLILPKDRH